MKQREGRLQRAPDFTGDRLESFQAVFLRHGLPFLLLGALLLVPAGARGLFAESLQPAATQPALYVGVFVTILLLLTAYVWRLDRAAPLQQIGWVLYLGALSIWEEWVFRLALPELLAGARLGVFSAMFASNVLFGAVHYFTLRWRWYWCVGAGLGGLALSREWIQHGDLFWLVGLHWVGTVLNTPKRPGASAR